MSVDSVIPISEANNVDNVAFLKCFNCKINIGFGTCEVSFDAEAIGIAVVGEIYVNIVTACATLIFNAHNCESQIGRAHV